MPATFQKLLPPPISGTGNPDGVVSGEFGQEFFATDFGVWYKNVTVSGSGTDWVTLGAWINTSATTVDDTTTTVTSIPLPVGAVADIQVRVRAKRTDADGFAVLHRWAAIRRIGVGSAQKEGPTRNGIQQRSTAQYNAFIETSGNSILLRVKGSVGHTLSWEVSHLVLVRT